MISRERFDIIIIGAGLSGLTLARELIKKTSKKILLLEKEGNKKKDKNWSYWNIPKNCFSDKFDFSWKKIKIKNGEEKIIKIAEKIKYLNISSETFYDDSLRIIRNSDNCKILFNQDIDYIYDDIKNVKVKLENNEYYSDLVFDSRPNLSSSNNKLIQHFFGIEVSSNSAVFDNETVTLMDFQKNEEATHFFYLLPFSNKKALVETTYFSRKKFSSDKYIKDINNYLKKNYPGSKFKFGFKEFGIIPMFREINKPFSKKVIKIGLSNNWSRTSTGYAFQNSFKNSEQIVNSIMNNRLINVKTKYLTVILDKIFCRFLEKYPKDSPNLFFTFFKKLKLRTIVNFLTDNYTILDILLILKSLPKLKLIYSMYLVIINK